MNEANLKTAQWSWYRIVTETSGLLLLLSMSWIPGAHAFRPFESTDADVVAAGELEIEWGALTAERQDDETAYVVPDLVFNLGLTDHTEVIGEFTAERTVEDQWELADPGAFVKTVWKDGVLQGETGLSLATEVGALLPGTPADEDGLGAEAIAIASLRAGPLILHLNAGGGVTRADSDAFGLAGLIAEYPVSRSVRLISEINGEMVEGEDTEASLLLGTIWSPHWFEGSMDFGVRGGLTDEAPDWAVTLGATIPLRDFINFMSPSINSPL